MKINLRIINDLYMIVFIIYYFVLSGFLSFFLGVSNTIISLFFSFSFVFWYLIKPNRIIRKEILNFGQITVFIIIYIFFTSFINKQGIIRPIIYSQFYLIPLILLFLIYENYNLTFRFLTLKKVKNWMLLLALLQLPILLIQNNFFDVLIGFNFSGQKIYSVDFEFGSFPLKNDHALGFFLVVNLLYIWSNKVLKNKLQLLLASIVLLVNLLLTNSNVSILFAAIAIAFLVLKKRNEIKIKISFKKILIILISLFFIIVLMEYTELKFYSDFKNKFSHKLDIRTSLKWFKKGFARREQIILVLLNDNITYLGHGAYAYFDILAGKFNRTFRHFSQLIWSYYDLGVIGLLAFFYYIKSLIKLFKHKRTSFNICLTIAIIMYSFFTIPTFDYSFMLTYFIYMLKDEN